MRRVLVYFVVDAPLSMSGEPISHFQKLIESFISQNNEDPFAIETIFISVISTNSLNCEVILPLSSIMNLKDTRLQIHCRGKSDIFRGLDRFKELIVTNLKKSTEVIKGDWGSVLFMLVGTIPQQDFPANYIEFFKRNLKTGTFDRPLYFLYNSEWALENFSEPINQKISESETIYYKNEYVGSYFKKYFTNVTELSTVMNRIN